MKGDIAVAGFKMTAEEWQALDPWQRADLVAVITRKDEQQFAAGSGPIPLELEPDPESGAIQSHGQLAGGADSGAIVGLRDRAADLAVVAVMCRTEVAAVESAAPELAAALAASIDSGPVIVIERELDFGSL